MQNASTLYKRIFLKTVCSKMFWLPTMLGVGVMTFTTGWPFWMGLGLLVLGVGNACWKLAIGQDALRAKVIDQINRESFQDHYQYLRELQSKLRQDKDPQTGKLLRQLRDTHKRLVDCGMIGHAEYLSWQGELNDRINRLYQSSVSSLEKSYQLWQDSMKVTAGDAQDRLLDSRSKILGEVVSNIAHLDRTLNEIQDESQPEIHDDQLARLRSEIDQGLEVAKNVEARIQALDQEIRSATQE